MSSLRSWGVSPPPLSSVEYHICTLWLIRLLWLGENWNIASRILFKQCFFYDVCLKYFHDWTISCEIWYVCLLYICMECIQYYHFSPQTHSETHSVAFFCWCFFYKHIHTKWKYSECTVGMVLLITPLVSHRTFLHIFIIFAQPGGQHGSVWVHSGHSDV